MSHKVKTSVLQHNGTAYSILHFTAHKGAVYKPLSFPYNLENDILFVNFTEDNRLDRFIHLHYVEIKEIYGSAGKNFIYLEQEKAFQNMNEGLSYNFPSLSDEEMDAWSRALEENFSTHFFTRSFFSTIYKQQIVSEEQADQSQKFKAKKKSRKIDFQPGKFGLLREVSPDQYAYVDMSVFSEKDYLSFFESHASTNYKELLFHAETLRKTDIVTKVADASFEDLEFDFEAAQLTAEIKQKMDRLMYKGYGELLLKMIAQTIHKEDLRKLVYLPENNPSPVLITRDSKIILPGFHNMEIKMTPLPKTVFLFFLRHPEGVIFKHLRDCREELLTIYSRLAAHQDPGKMVQRISDLTDPRHNSIHEKCSRIKEAFIRKMEDRIAANYYLCAGRGEEKYIPIAREDNMIHWEVSPDAR